MGKCSNMLMNELELSYRWNSGWHCKNMVSCFVPKSIYYNSWFGQFLFLKISIKSSTTDMFCQLKSLVRGILQKISISLKETLIQCADWFTYFVKKKQVFEVTENKSRWFEMSHRDNRRSWLQSIHCLFSFIYWIELIILTKYLKSS